MKTQDLVRELLEVTERFNRDESPQIGRAYHATKIIHLTSKIFADSNRKWLSQPNKMLDNQIPLEIIDSDDGLQKIESLLNEPSEVVDYAIEVFEDESTANKWLSTPNAYLEDLTPRNVLDSSEGIKKVRDMLLRINYGVYS
jgi:uncharacterized protein (DUF2384 family)